MSDRQDIDGSAHLTYFDPRTQASFRWDGASDTVEVGIGGYGEPIDHTIPAPFAPHNPRRVDVLWFADLCRGHALTLPTFGGVPA